MRDERDVRVRVHARNSGLRRLKVLTGVAALVTAALAGIFAGLAAQTSAARKVIRVRVRRAVAAEKATAARRRPVAIPPPPKLPPLGANAAPAAAPEPAQPPPPPPPVQAPAPAPAPAVVVSGGS
jgi:hypothetical protein